MERKKVENISPSHSSPNGLPTDSWVALRNTRSWARCNCPWSDVSSGWWRERWRSCPGSASGRRGRGREVCSAVVGVEYEVHALFHRGMLLLRTAYFLEVLPWVVVPSATTILARRTISCYCAGGNQFTWPLSPEVGRASALGTLSWNSLSFMC